MMWLLIAAGVAALVLFLSLVCFLIAFYVFRQNKEEDRYQIPPGDIYAPFKEQMVNWMKELDRMPFEEVSIRSRDGLMLYGKYYEYKPGAPIELMFHGYRGNARRDLCGGVQRCFALGRSALIVDQRTSGKSQGHVITFGIRECEDCLLWTDFMCRKFGPDVKIILTGISMGASTVLLAAGRTLPENVTGVLADCGYTGAKQIICKVIRQIGLPSWLLYPFVRLGAMVYGGFDPEKDAPVEALRRSQVPVIFFHGEKDDFVPCEMSRENYSACASRKMLVTVPEAGHGLSFPVDPETYLQALRDFFGSGKGD